MRPIGTILAEGEALRRANTYPQEGLAAQVGFLTRELKEAGEEIAQAKNLRVERVKGRWYVDSWLGDVPVLLEADYEKGDPGRHTLSNGDPGYPPTPASTSVYAVWIGGTLVEDLDTIFTEWQLERWNEAAETAISEALSDRDEE
jgi:hypothetical protein